MIDQVSRQLPAFALYPATGILLVALLLAMRSVQPASGKFLLAIVWLRYIMQSFHEVTFAPAIGGASWNAIASLLVCLAGFAIVFPRLRLISGFPFILSLIGVIAASGMINGLWIPMIETLLKWGYFIVVLLCAYDCMQRDGDGRIFKALIWAIAPLVLMQALSIALGVTKATESDGSVSFIGGFHHEASFSVALITGFLIVSLAPRLHPAFRIAALAYFVFAIYLANYRTSLLALAPIALGYLTFSGARAFTPRDRLLVSMAALILATGTAIGGGWLMRERLTDINVAAGSSGDLVKAPDEFSTAERKLFSGRLYIWNRYYDEYKAGDDTQLIIGKGPDAWEAVFGVYAHNTLISYLYEFGMLGAVLVLLIWASMLARAISVRDPWLRGQLVFAHLGFIVLNFATMPFWQIEGLILYGLLCGATLYATRAQAAIDPPYAARGLGRALHAGARVGGVTGLRH